MPIRARDTLHALADALAADPTIRAQTMTAEDGPDGPADAPVFTHRLPKPPSDAAWARIVVRELNVGGLPEHATGLVHLPVQVLCEVNPGLGSALDPSLLLEAMHHRILDVFSDTPIDTDHGENVGRVGRRRRPTPIHFDEKTGAYFSAALFSVVLQDS